VLIVKGRQRNRSISKHRLGTEDPDAKEKQTLNDWPNLFGF
jgi:hypothetical protein